MAHNVKCYYCERIFDRDKVPFIQVNSRRYAHKSCADSLTEQQKQEDIDKQNLETYIIKLFNEDYVSLKIKRQIEEYVTKYNYTYSGMLKALKYFYEIKNNSIEKSNGGIGIIPYIYQEAFNYYYSLWEMKQKNVNKVLEDYVPKDIVIKIPTPQRNVKKREKFTFLDN